MDYIPKILCTPLSVGPDFGLLDETVTLVRQEESQCFDIPIIDDSVVEPAESFVVSLSEPNGVTLGADSDVRIFIVNDADCKTENRNVEMYT